MQRKQEMMTIVAQKQLAPRIYQLDLQGELVKDMTVCAYQGSACRFTFAATD